MSEFYNAVLLEPSEECLVAALEEASRQHVPAADRLDYWSPLLRDVTRNAEGRTQLEHGAVGPDIALRYLSVAWWTDRHGRKHVRLVGGDTHPRGGDRHYSRLDHDPRPPLWHISPENVYRVECGGAFAWVVHCPSCGETGTAEQLAWRGDSCGICHDRREEQDPGLRPVAPSAFAVADSVCSLAFHPSQPTLAVGGTRLTLVDLGSGQARPAAAGPDGSHPLAPALYSPDGRWLVAGEILGSHLHLWRGDSHQPLPRLRLAQDDSAQQVVQVAFTADSRHLAAGGSAHQVALWELDRWRWQRLAPIPGRAFAFREEDGALLIGDASGELRVLGVGDWKQRAQVLTCPVPLGELQWLQPLPGGRLLLVTGEQNTSLAQGNGPPWAMQVWDPASGRTLRRREMHCGAFALSPDARHFAHVDGQVLRASQAVVHVWDVADWRSAGAVEWNPELQLTELAFSADGQTLASGSFEGVVKLWPWRLLLGL